MTEFTPPVLLASARLADTSAVENPTASLHVKTFNGPAGSRPIAYRENIQSGKRVGTSLRLHLSDERHFMWA